MGISLSDNLNEIMTISWTAGVTEQDLESLLDEARQLMSRAQELLDVAKAWESSAHLDLAIHRLNSILAGSLDILPTHQ